MKPSLYLLSVLVMVGCATTQTVNKKPSVNMSEPRRLVGTDNGVRVDAQLSGDQLGPNVTLGLKYEVTNERSTPILIADLLPQANYDPDTRTVTVDIGTEIPGAEFLPRLIPVQSGEKKSFSTGVHVVIMMNLKMPQPRPNALRLRVNFLDNTQPFEKLIAIPEKAVRDPQLADQLFTKWVEGNETVFTNAVPMRWMYAAPDEDSTIQTGGRPKRTGS